MIELYLKSSILKLNLANQITNTKKKMNNYKQISKKKSKIFLI